MTSPLYEDGGAHPLLGPGTYQVGVGSVLITGCGCAMAIAPGGKIVGCLESCCFHGGTRRALCPLPGVGS